MITRILSGIMLLPLLLTIMIAGLPLYILGFVLTAISINEFTKALSIKKIQNYQVIGYILSTVFLLKNIFNLNNRYFIFIILGIFLISILYVAFKKHNIKHLFLSLIGMFYIILGFDSIISIINNFNLGNIYVWLIFIVSVLSDTMAYFVGSCFGKHKLVPRLSPKKTIEGSIGAIFFSTLGCFIFGKVFSLNISLMIIVGVLGSIVSQIGDLLASFVKRCVGIKDYGNLIPGHGGILDRCDSVILVSQFIYIILSLMQ